MHKQFKPKNTMPMIPYGIHYVHLNCLLFLRFPFNSIFSWMTRAAFLKLFDNEIQLNF